MIPKFAAALAAVAALALLAAPADAATKKKRGAPVATIT